MPGKQKYLKDFPRFSFSSTETMEVGGRVWCVCTTHAKGFCLTLLLTGEEALRACRSRVCMFYDSRLCTAGFWLSEGAKNGKIKKNCTRIHQDGAG